MGSKLAQNDPKWSQMVPKGPHQYSMVILCPTIHELGPFSRLNNKSVFGVLTFAQLTDDVKMIKNDNEGGRRSKRGQYPPDKAKKLNFDHVTVFLACYLFNTN